ncbi:DEAD/DEAH box helicase [Ruicaihuangia caeni]|uniref:DUF3516 domain-containing protein n=1 Tax=Ruicaihuangia caeni TaxID=3042517 RepID=A0AAW6T964_9MICO|nr:DEAD/DEAH box helicase [Klugiella sp. YN-L-19]MDI2097905.1 DUF3516 domain-containing protein [Klugiella sp. YN-L-19]
MTDHSGDRETAPLTALLNRSLHSSAAEQTGDARADGGPSEGVGVDLDELLERFAEWNSARGIRLYPAQEDALLHLFASDHVVLSTPTGSGKSLVAIGAHLAALAQGRRSYYTAPIKALVSEKFFALVELFGTDAVGMVTGDSAVNPDAPIICCTAEILANRALRHGDAAGADVVVMDEFHFYADTERGWAWQVPLITLEKTQFLLMSATLGDVTALSDDFERRTGREVGLVTGVERPVPLHFSYSLDPINETIEELLETHRAPVYVVHFAQAAAVERAQALLSTRIIGREARDEIAAAIGDFRFTTGFGKTLSRLVRAGIGVHHAGMLPRYRRLVEQLAQRGLLRVICGTDTLGVGINVPIRTVLLTSLTKYDGTKTRRLSAREFHQIVGRAGRAGFDTAGTVVVQAPEHEIENARAIRKAGDDVKKQRRVVRKKAPEGFVSWSEQTMQKLISAEPEPLRSSMRISAAMIINVIARGGDVLAHLRRLVFDNHEPPVRQYALARRALSIARTLRAADLLQTGADGIRLTVDLQEDFALNQPLSPFAIAALELLDPDAETYALDQLSVIEATLDDPRALLNQQQFMARGEAVAAMKADGIEYEERMELLDDVTHPKPLAELLEQAFETFAASQPWVRDFELSPKSVVRDMTERAMSFTEYVSHYQLARSEGVLLRYLSDAYRAVRQTVPENLKSERLRELIEWLGELVRQTDSSLLDEWAELSNPALHAAREEAIVPPAPPALSSNARALRVLVRNELFRRVELAALRRYDALAALEERGWSAEQWQAALEPYWSEHDWIGTDAAARGPGMITIDEEPGRWKARQTLADPVGDHDWIIEAEVDLAESDHAGEAIVEVVAVVRL